MQWDKKFRDSWTPKCTCPNKRERRKLYQEYEKEYKMNTAPTVPAAITGISTASYIDNWTFPPVTLQSYGSLACTTCPDLEKYIRPVNKEEGNNPMNYATATVQAGTTETQDQRKYLTQRLENIYYKLEAPLYAQFGLDDDMPPSSPKELKERIKAGKFTIKGIKADVDGEDDYDDDGIYFGSWASMIRWRDPSVKADSEGYEAARKELMDLRQKTLDTIKIDEPKAGLDAIKALEAWKPTGAAN